MKKTTSRLLCGVLAGILLFAAGCGSQPDVPTAGLGETTGRLSGLEPVDTLPEDYAQGYGGFTASMLKALYADRKQTPSQDTSDGVFFSPASLYMALGMTAAGMEKDTLSQTLTVLGAKDRQALHAGNLALQSLLSGNSKQYFKLSNAIWLRDEYRENILPTFLGTNKTYYGALVTPHPFDDTLIPEINAWVAENTDDLIKDLLQPPLNPDAFMFLVNTLLFEAEWQTPFGTTAESTFHSEQGDKKM